MTARRSVALRAMTEFRCLGPSCSDTCCAGWRISVDEPHLVQLRRVMPEIDRAIVRDEERVVLAKDGDGRCVLLDGDGGCSVHRRFGEDALFDICAHYPRRILATETRYELTGELSCPEVARLVLGEHGTEIAACDPARLGRPSEIFGAPRVLGERAWGACLDRVRGVLHGVLHTRYPFASRLYALAWFAEQVGRFLDGTTPVVDGPRLDAEIARLPGVLDELHARLGAAELPGGLGWQAVIRVLAARLEHRTSPGFRRLFTDAMARFEGGALTGDGDARAIDPAALAREWPPLRDAGEAALGVRLDRWLERYGTHWVMHDPYVAAPSLTVHVQRFLLRVACVRFLLLANLRDGVDPDALAVDVVYHFARAMEHVAGLVDRSADFLLADAPTLTAAAYLARI